MSTMRHSWDRAASTVRTPQPRASSYSFLTLFAGSALAASTGSLWMHFPWSSWRMPTLQALVFSCTRVGGMALLEVLAGLNT
jgi:hypothetical protein